VQQHQHSQPTYGHQGQHQRIGGVMYSFGSQAVGVLPQTCPLTVRRNVSRPAMIAGVLLWCGSGRGSGPDLQALLPWENWWRGALRAAIGRSSLTKDGRAFSSCTDKTRERTAIVTVFVRGFATVVASMPGACWFVWKIVSETFASRLPAIVLLWCSKQRPLDLESRSLQAPGPS
jgi:hypothetical protein